MKFITVFLILVSTSTFAEKITGKVLRVLDGDTIEISYKKSDDYSYYSSPAKAIIRLNGIDAPESNQPGGRIARNILIRLTHEKEIVADISSKDKYGRFVGDVYAKEKSIYSWNSSDAEMQFLNLEMIKEGMAWNYKQYSSNQTFAKAELTARKQKVGIWKSNNPIPPWEWRTQEHPPSKTVNAKELSSYEVNQLIESKINVIVDTNFSSYDIKSFLSKNSELVTIFCKDSPSVLSRNYSSTMLDNHFSSYDVKEFIEAGGSVIVDTSYSSYDIKEFLEENAELVTIICKDSPSVLSRNYSSTILENHFSSYDVKEFLDERGSIIVDQSYSSYDVKEFIEKSPQLVSILARGFSEWDIKEFEALDGHIIK